MRPPDSRPAVTTVVVKVGGPYPRGMTLLEVMIALVVLEIGLLGSVPFVTTAVSTNVAARRLTEANLLVQEKIEELSRITAYTINPSYTLTSLNAGTTTETVSRSNLKGDYTREWTVTDATPRVDMKRVVVTASWTEGTPAVAHSVSVTTIIAAKDRRFY